MRKAPDVFGSDLRLLSRNPRQSSQIRGGMLWGIEEEIEEVIVYFN